MSVNYHRWCIKYLCSRQFMGYTLLQLIDICGPSKLQCFHDDVINWKHFPRYWPFVGGIHRSPVNSPHKGQWRGALMFSLICAWINRWVNTREAGDLRRNRAHYDAIVMFHEEIEHGCISYFHSFIQKASSRKRSITPICILTTSI